LGHNVRASGAYVVPHPQLNAPHPGSISGATTFIGDYFGIHSTGTAMVTTSVSTYDAGENPSHYQQQIVARVPIP